MATPQGKGSGGGHLPKMPHPGSAIGVFYKSYDLLMYSTVLCSQDKAILFYCLCRLNCIQHNDVESIVMCAHSIYKEAIAWSFTIHRMVSEESK